MKNSRLRALYGDQAEQVAVQLARHFQAAGNVDKAVDYLLQAGERARRLPANMASSISVTPKYGQRRRPVEVAAANPGGP